MAKSATTTRKRSAKGTKGAKDKPATDVRQAAKAIQNGQADPLAVNATDDDLPASVKRGKGAGSKFDRKQGTLVDDVDDRVPELDEACDRVLALEVKRKELKSQLDETKGEIGGLLKEHGLDLYIVKGEKFYVVKGSPEVKHTKVNQKG